MNKFLSALNGWQSNKAKASLMTSAKRAKLVRNKMLKDIRVAEREIVQFIQDERLDKTRIKAEQVIQYRRMEGAMDIVESMCDLLETRIAYIDQSSSIPKDLIQPISSLFYASERCEVPELAEVRTQLSAKFSRKDLDFVPERDVHPKLLSLLTVTPPEEFEIEALISEIAAANKVTYSAPQAPAPPSFPKPPPNAPVVTHEVASILASLPAAPGSQRNSHSSSPPPSAPPASGPPPSAPPASGPPPSAPPASGPPPSAPPGDDLAARLKRLKD